MAQAGLDDALSAISTTSADSAQGSRASVEDRLEAMLSGVTPKTAVKEDAEETLEAPEEESDDSTETEDTEEVDEEESDDSKDAEDEDEESEDDDETIELTEEQLAASLGLKAGEVRVDDEGHTLIRTKVDGKVEFVPLKDITASYQMEKHLQERIRTVAEEKKQFDTVKKTETDKLQTVVTEAVSITRAMEQQMFAEYNGVDFNAVKRQDPGKWAAMQQDIAQKKQYLQQVKGQLGKTIAEQKASFDNAETGRRQARVLAETEKLIDAIPSWSNPEVAAREIEALTPAAKALGFTEEDLANVDDHRLILAIRGYAKSMGMDETTSIVKKKLKSIPKITKPGSKKVNTQTRNEREHARLISNVKSSGGSTDAVAAALLARL